MSGPSSGSEPVCTSPDRSQTASPGLEALERVGTAGRLEPHVSAGLEHPARRGTHLGVVVHQEDALAPT